jgi:hypothetical protein
LSVSCSAPTEDVEESGDASSALAAQSSNAEVLATGTLPNGNTLQVFDMGDDGILIEEVGKSRKPATSGNSAESLRAAWKSIAPQKAMPVELEMLEDDPPSQEQDQASQPVGQAGGDQVLVSKSGCGVTGLLCCDANWLLDQCQPAQALGDWTWSMADYGWSWAQSNDKVSAARAFACAGKGTSKHWLKIGSTWGSPTILPEGWYTNRSWLAGWNIFTGTQERHVRSQVNTSDDMHSHSQCGSILN